MVQELEISLYIKGIQINSHYNVSYNHFYLCRASDEDMKPLKEVNEVGNMDVNKWLRQNIELPIGEDYRIIIEATVGWPSESDIAIDDVSFTPDCM